MSVKTTKISIKNNSELLDYIRDKNLTWEAKECDLYSGTNIGGIITNPQIVSSHKGIIREDSGQLLAVNKSSYGIIQNEEVFSIASLIPNVSWTKIWEIDSGAKLIVEGETESNDAEMKQKICLQNSFDGSLPFGAEFYLWRQVCSNGMFGWSKDYSVSIRHSKNSGQRVNEAYQILAKSQKSFEQLNDFRARLKSIRADKKLVETFLNDLFDIKSKEDASTRSKNQMDEIENLFQNGKGNKGKTLWDLYNGATEYFQHSGKNEEKQLKSTLVGAAKRKSSEALKIALSLV